MIENIDSVNEKLSFDVTVVSYVLCVMTCGEWEMWETLHGFAIRVSKADTAQFLPREGNVLFV